MDLKASNYLSVLHWTRGLAALVVVLFHTSVYFDPSASALGFAFGGYFHVGHLGVQVFFVLSGFLMTYMHFRDAGNRSELYEYFRRRLRRIYPPAWAVVLVCALAIPGARWITQTPELFDFSIRASIVSLTLIPLERLYFPSVLWTLSHEMLFYAVFSLIFFSKRVFFIICSLWFISIISYNIIYKMQILYWPTDVLFGQYNINFFLGILSARLAASDRFQSIDPTRVCYTAMIVIVASTVIEYIAIFKISPGSGRSAGKLVSYAGYGLGTAALLWAASRLKQVKTNNRTKLLLDFFGNISYSLYLTHWFVIAVGVRVGLLHAPALKAYPELFMILICALCIAAGHATQKWLELPAMRLFDRWLMRPARLRQG